MSGNTVSEELPFEATVAETVYKINKQNEREKKFREVAEVYERVVGFIKDHADEIKDYIENNPNHRYSALFYPIYENGEMVLQVEVWESPFQHGFSESFGYNRFYITISKRDLEAFGRGKSVEEYLLEQVRTQLGYNMQDVHS